MRIIAPVIRICIEVYCWERKFIFYLEIFVQTYSKDEEIQK